MELSFPWNLALFGFINAPEGANDAVVLIAKAFAVFSPWLVIGILVWRWFSGSIEIRRSLMIAGIALGLGLVVNFSIAFLIYVPRPFEMGIGNSLLSHGLETSFPSDHVTFLLSLGFALLFTRTLRWYGGVISGLGIVVAWARIYLGVHFPLDMAASFLIAFFAALIARALSEKLDEVFFQPVERINTTLLKLIFRNNIKRR